VPLPHETRRRGLTHTITSIFKLANELGLHRRNLWRPFHPLLPRIYLPPHEALLADPAPSQDNMLFTRMLEIWMCKMLYFSVRLLLLWCMNRSYQFVLSIWCSIDITLVFFGTYIRPQKHLCPHGGLDIKFIGKCLHDTSMTTKNSEFGTIWLQNDATSLKYIANWPTAGEI